MSAFKGTPGPWRPSRHGPSDLTYGIEAGPSHDSVKIVKWGGIGRPHSETGQANARLIAAAPELLEALVALFNDYKRLADSGDAGFWRLEDVPEGKQALAAIAKATGETP